jgi:hypothetical protein
VIGSVEVRSARYLMGLLGQTEAVMRAALKSRRHHRSPEQLRLAAARTPVLDLDTSGMLAQAHWAEGSASSVQVGDQPERQFPGGIRNSSRCLKLPQRKYVGGMPVRVRGDALFASFLTQPVILQGAHHAPA